MKSPLNRRRFVQSAAAASALTIVPRHVLGGAGRVAPNDKITLAHIGMGTQGFRELGGLLEEPAIQIVAVCDPNEKEDYSRFYYGGVAGRLPAGREGGSR